MMNSEDLRMAAEELRKAIEDYNDIAEQLEDRLSKVEEKRKAYNELLRKCLDKIERELRGTDREGESSACQEIPANEWIVKYIDDADALIDVENLEDQHGWFFENV